MHSLLRATVLLGAGVLLATSVATTSAAAPGETAGTSVPVTKIQPPRLKEGPAPTFAHVEGTTVVDGAVRIPVDADHVSLLGESGTAYVAMVVDEDTRRVVRLTPDGASRVLMADAGSLNVTLSDDGEDLLALRLRSSGRTDVRVLDATDGSTVDTRRFRGLVTVLDADRQRVVLGSWGPTKTFWWNTRTDRTRRIVAQAGGIADIAADRLATYTADPYDGGCTVVRKLSRPGVALWKSCTERPVAFAPGGRSMATVALLSDGIGPKDVTARRISGRKLAEYRTGWFGLVQWESASALVLDANGRTKHALVRCVRATCERVGPLASTPTL